MSEYEINVVGGPPPRRPDGPVRRLLRTTGRIAHAVLMRPRLMVATGLASFVLIAGTPHVGGEYECRHHMRGPGTCRSVAWCAYYGAQGRRVVVPENGAQCSLISIQPIDWAQLM
jgi:hypothetical protein